MKINSITDIGLKRAENEDAIYTFSFDEKNYICVLCDGMGGHKGGKAAANYACTIMRKEFKKLLQSNEKPLAWLTNTYVLVNNKILERSKEDEALDGMGTTMTTIICIKGHLYYGHVGDTRIYSITKKGLRQITEDHTYVNVLVKKGIVSQDEAKIHPQRHILVNVMGVNEQLDIETGKLNMEDGLLICTDGLYDLVDEKDIFAFLTSNENSLTKIVNLAKECGGRDNISAIYIDGRENH